MKRIFSALLLISFLSLAGSAKNEPAITMVWPAERPALKLTFEKLRQMCAHAGQGRFISNVTVQNLADNQMPRGAFAVYFMDKNSTGL